MFSAPAEGEQVGDKTRDRFDQDLRSLEKAGRLVY